MSNFRRLASLPQIPFYRTPAFWLALFGWVLCSQTLRFWIDWGLPALIVLAVSDLDRRMLESLLRLEDGKGDLRFVAVPVP